MALVNIYELDSLISSILVNKNRNVGIVPVAININGVNQYHKWHENTLNYFAEIPNSVLTSSAAVFTSILLTNGSASGAAGLGTEDSMTSDSSSDNAPIGRATLQLDADMYDPFKSYVEESILDLDIKRALESYSPSRSSAKLMCHELFEWIETNFGPYSSPLSQSLLSPLVMAQKLFGTIDRAKKQFVSLQRRHKAWAATMDPRNAVIWISIGTFSCLSHHSNFCSNTIALFSSFSRSPFASGIMRVLLSTFILGSVASIEMRLFYFSCVKGETTLERAFCFLLFLGIQAIPFIIWVVMDKEMQKRNLCALLVVILILEVSIVAAKERTIYSGASL